MSWLSRALHAVNDAYVSPVGTQYEKKPLLDDIAQFLVGLPQLIKNVEQQIGSGNGATKKVAVIAAFVAIIKELEPWLDVTLPQYAAIIDKSVDFFVSLLNIVENLSGKILAPPPSN